ncbi:MAG: FAD-binding protein [Dehalococcoidia bacterium]|nr:FAD-binding protein [Dehalococcoidia bacterium]
MNQAETLAGKLVETDVLVLGGGAGGCAAAISAGREGARVLMVEKGPLLTSGSLGMYPTTLHVVMKHRQPYEEALQIEREAIEGLVHPPVFDIIYQESFDRLQDLERWGIEFVKDRTTGDYAIREMVGLLHVYLADPVAKGFKPTIAREALKAGARVEEWTMATNLLVSEGQVVGATGLNLRSGEFCVFRAKATILATGTGVRLYQPANGEPYMSWHCPYCSGDGHAMAYRAGAELANMEFPCATLVVKGLASPRAIIFLHLGSNNGYLVNALGERFMGRYDPLRLEGARRNLLCQAVLTEKREGRGPIYIDTRAIPSREVEATLGKWRKKGSEATLLQFLEAQGVQIGRDLLEVDVGEPSLYNGGVSGCVIGGNGETSLPGLYACGDSASGLAVRGVMGAFAVGWRAGGHGAAHSKKERQPPVDLTQVDRERERIFAPLQKRGRFSARQVEERLNQIMSDYVGFVRNESGLMTALEHIARTRSRSAEVGAKDVHGLQKTLELANLLDCSEMVTRAALFRCESRCVPFHYRSDYPARDDEHWLAWSVIKKEKGTMLVKKRPLEARASHAGNI